MKNHSLFVNFEKAAKFKIVVRCTLKVALYGLKQLRAAVSHNALNCNFSNKYASMNTIAIRAKHRK